LNNIEAKTIIATFVKGLMKHYVKHVKDTRLCLGSVPTMILT